MSEQPEPTCCLRTETNAEQERGGVEQQVLKYLSIGSIALCSLLQCAQIAKINLSAPGYPGIWGNSLRQRPDLCDFAQIFMMQCAFSKILGCLPDDKVMH